MQDIFTGKELKDNMRYAEAMKKADESKIEPANAAQEDTGQLDSTEEFNDSAPQ
jgi:hypothetical protein